MEDNKIVSVLNNSLSKKKVKFKDYYGDNHVLNIKADTYYFTGNLSLQTYEEGLPYARITVNISPLPPNEVAIDVNNFPEALKILYDNNIAFPTEKVIRSGYCIYPIWRIRPQLLPGTEYYDLWSDTEEGNKIE